MIYETQCEDGFCVIGAKAARVLPLVSPQTVSLEQLEDARRALDALNRDIFTPVDPEPTPTQLNAASSEDYEQDQDSEHSNQWKNPKASGSTKPKRKGSQEEA